LKTQVQRWERIERLFYEALEQTPETRAAWLERACAGDPGLHAEVASLLENDNAAGPRFVGAIRQAALDLCEEEVARPALEGQLVGHWRLIRELGQGGMGTVYLAVRADDQYESQAAIKLVRRGVDTDFMLHRFRCERQILARLEHPNITRLLDGGTTDDGIPYLVMEYIDGLWITRYAAEHKLSVEDRVRLCLPVCTAVAYAHRNFVVHRDLKPANILIDANGAPKLLDFGISKLLHSDQPEPLNTQGAAMMTPDYASPEQILGDPVTLVSDVYSLGAVLYELLTGTRPHRMENCTPLALERAICVNPVMPPSVAASADGALARRLKGDLDNIILRAMQKEPARRYVSAEHLAEDLTRYLEHRPVSARPDSTGYRMGKFTRRNRASVALGAIAALAVLTGALVAGLEARNARERFEDVRKLATTFVFDVEDAVRPLPGSTHVRQLIARTGVEYLNSLSRSSARDWDLKRELASAWLRIGVVQGGQGSSNLADPVSALVSFANASQLLDEVLRHDPSDAKAALDRMMVFCETSDLQWGLGRYREATASAQAGLRIAESRTAATRKDPGVAQYTGLLHLALARLLPLAGDLNGAESEAAAGARILRQAAAVKPDNREAQLGLANLEACLGSIESQLGRRDDALASYRRGVSVMEALCRRFPADTRARRELMFAYSHVGDTLSKAINFHDDSGDLPGAFQAYGKMAEQAAFLYEADPADARALGDYGIALLRLGKVTPPAGSLRRQTLERSRELLNRAAAANPQNRMIATHIIWVETELGNYAVAIARGEKMLSGALDDWTVQRILAGAVRPLAEEQAHSGQRVEAVATLDHSIHWAEKMDTAAPRTFEAKAIVGVARAWQTAGSVYAILAGLETGQQAAADREKARAYYRRALDDWRKVEHDKTFFPPLPAEMKAAERALAPAGLDPKRVGHR
jgi:serine/threonine protein kinase/tetratricopeptide (TPR) repeat protein